MNIPVLDPASAESIRECISHGFFQVAIDQEHQQIITDVLDEMKRFFEQDISIKEKEQRTNDGLGYYKGTTVTKESLSYRYGSNVIYNKYMDIVHIYSLKTYNAILSHFSIDLPTEFLPTLHLVHYPEQTSNQIGIAEHSDWGYLTLLVTTAEGLQIEKGGTYIPIPCPCPCTPSHFIVNIGDMLARLTKGHAKATKHQVINLHEKYSIVYFLEPGLEVVIDGIVFADYLKEKLGEGV